MVVVMVTPVMMPRVRAGGTRHREHRDETQQEREHLGTP
jgi:hypothetical protein